MEFYLRVEAVNLSNFIFDTTDLSTVRGGGLLLLKAIEDIKTEFSKRAEFQDLEAISTGASSGLFSFSSEKKPDELRKAVFKFLNEHNKFKHATFVIDVLPVGKDFTEDKEKLLALNRWQQMQSPTVIFPKNDPQNAKFPICQVNDIYPSSSHKIQKGDENLIVSESVYQRREYGREQKQSFYTKQTGLDNLPNFTNDFQSLACDENQGNLHNKMAVIYLDGNSFGSLQQGLDQNNLQKFDDIIKGYRRRFLHNLLKAAIHDSENWITTAGQLRLEILLWGGDEILLVVPAWKGWWTLNFFFESSKDWCFLDKLTHAAGLVFCHHNAPIHRIKDLAIKLGDLAKAKSREVSSVAYQVLESFDHTGLEIEEFRQKRLASSGIKQNDLIIIGEQMCQYEKVMLTVKEILPKNRVHKIVNALLYEQSQLKMLVKEAEKQLEESLEDLSLLKEDTFWLHLIELWDYINPTEGEILLCT